jgi:hypothetical protein
MNPRSTLVIPYSSYLTITIKLNNFGRIRATSLREQSAGSPSINIVLEDSSGLRWSGSLKDDTYRVSYVLVEVK